MQPTQSAPQPDAFIFDVVGVPDFQEKVMHASMDTPVLVDFWAPWCQPCKTLTPTLEKVVKDYRGAVLLAKVNVDEAQQLAMAFRVQSVPTVYLFFQGQPVDGFQGAQPESAIRALLDQVAAPPKAAPLEVGREAFAKGDMITAEQAFTEVLADEPKHGESLLALARIALGRGAATTAAGWLDRIPREDPAFAQAERMRGAFKFAEDAGDLVALEAAVAANPGDTASWYALGATRATRGDMEGACKAFLKVVTLDRGFREDGGRSALLAIFDVLGGDDPLVATYRRRLASMLF